LDTCIPLWEEPTAKALTYYLLSVDSGVCFAEEFGLLLVINIRRGVVKVDAGNLIARCGGSWFRVSTPVVLTLAHSGLDNISVKKLKISTRIIWELYYVHLESCKHA